MLCEGNRRNCEILLRLAESHAKFCEEAGLTDPGSILRATAVGLVIEVWRNGPVEDMHASRRGPSDTAMFAESTALHDVAIETLEASNRSYGLLDFEEYLLDRTRPWAGTDGKTLKDLGYGFLGEYRRHVKDRINSLTAISDHTCVSDPLHVYLVRRAALYGRNHKGMPGWSAIVDRIGILLAEPDHPAWMNPDLGIEARAEKPQHLQISRPAHQRTSY